MPIYEYRCEKGHTFEVMQRMSDDPVTSCSTCEAPVQRVFHPVAVHFKGSGFYRTDSRKSGAATDGAARSEKSGDKSGEKAADKSTDKVTKSGDKAASSSSSADSGSSSASKSTASSSAKAAASA